MPEQTTLLFGRKGPKIGSIQLDVGESENHNYKSEVTNFPVEKGYDVNDNIRKLPEELSITGIITNTPLEVVYEDITEQVESDSNKSTIKVNERVNNPTFVEVAQNELLALTGRTIQGQESVPKVFDIITGLRVYTNMVVTSLVFPRNASTGQALRIQISFIKINVVDSKTVLIPTPQPEFKDKTQSKIEKGKETPSTSTKEETKRVSVAKSAYNKITQGLPF